MKKILFNFALAVACSSAISISLVACSSSDEPATNERQDIELSASTRATAEELKDFYPRFTIDAINSNGKFDDGSQNVIVSPISASMLLGMVANGVEDNIARQIEGYLGVSELSSMNALAASLLNALPNVDRKSKLSLNNSVWYGKNYILSEKFSSAVSSAFNARLTSIDFASSSSLETINKWISSSTGGLIGSYLDYSAVNPQTLAIMLNTLHFKGEWADEVFDMNLTKKEIFYGFKKESNVDMMSGSTIYPYAETDNYQACMLYFGNHAFSLMLILPSEEAAGKENYPVITPEEVEELRNGMSNEFFTLRLPKFKAGCQTNLNKVMQMAGLEDLNGIINFTMFNPTQPGDILMNQGTSLSIDEKGAEAAAVSEGDIAVTAPPVKGHLKFNRPFYFFLNETSTGACILSGRIADL